MTRPGGPLGNDAHYRLVGLGGPRWPWTPESPHLKRERAPVPATPIMSLRFEQYWALRKTRDFLWDLLDPRKRPKTAAEMRQRARSCSKHFPFLEESGKPIFSQDEFGPDDPPGWAAKKSKKRKKK